METGCIDSLVCNYNICYNIGGLKTFITSDVM